MHLAHRSRHMRERPLSRTFCSVVAVYALLKCNLAPSIQAQSRQSLSATLSAQASSEARFEAKARVLLEERRDFKEKVGSSTGGKGHVYVFQRQRKIRR